MNPITDRLAGTLLGTALGDALGLPAEGMSARAIARRFGRMDRFHLLGRTGFVSDDTEQSALVAQSLIRYPDDLEQCTRAFRRSLLGWFCRLPWGVGLATIRACVRIGFGIRPSGVMSAGNGAAMRAAIVGAFFHDRVEPRRAFGRALAQVTHRDERAIEGALYVAELTAACIRSTQETSAAACQQEARQVVTHPELGQAIDRARQLALKGVSHEAAARSCGTSGYVVQTLAFATFCFVRQGPDPLPVLSDAIAAGGDTDSIGAILGAWLGALHGESGLPIDLINRIHNGPFGPSHLRALAANLARAKNGQSSRPPSYSKTAAMIRNLALFPIILGHGFRRLLPP
ncbi:ADP-ribosylglycohydrolase [Singulisphaera sp. GP187]|uniref:ADP-ribosylglycohydrolase family protein n=1 Tax=Singulisphaera sp. GP187 TaxID=1882752 RepID=UPI00092934EC|nr:ADP-ribosylglycohydrolase family protein [Singulisphaera sp. GP187]SIN71607.1 ADP-ribosylglycohydrolase [Singulisphaera sp. GP187]